ncbi:MAG: enoyl-CoA hydratase-related protein [Alphaproteobacteria bacterium]|nr:enoyl-CoA hydratase-related protein [Alphaproteobacteria bacterium]
MSDILPPNTQSLDSGAARLIAGLETTANGIIGHVRFNLPEKHNVIDLEGWQAIAPLMQTLAKTPDMRLIILRGVGGKAFVAGADIAQFEQVLSGGPHTENGGTDFDRATIAAFDAIADCPIPTLAAIEGYCIGGGLGIAAACDLRLARKDSRFGIPAGKLGLAYPANATHQLARLVGVSEAKRIIFTAATLNVPDALNNGLISLSAEATDFDATLAMLVNQVSANAPMSLQASKFVLNNPQADADEVKKRLADCLASADYEEGRRAFMEKRKPEFKGR